MKISSGEEAVIPIPIYPEEYKPLLNIEYALTFNIPFIVVSLDKILNPDTFKPDINVVLLLNIEFALTFNTPLIVVLLYRIVNPETFNDEINVALLLK